jgi:hypothetical protein
MRHPLGIPVVLRTYAFIRSGTIDPASVDVDLDVSKKRQKVLREFPGDYWGAFTFFFFTCPWA